jgi:hypothetical protein
MENNKMIKQRILSIITAMAIILAFAVGCGNSTPNEGGSTGTDYSSEDENPSAGGFSEARELTDEDREVFEQAMADLLGVVYEPVEVATQVVAGTNYRFTCMATAVVPDAQPYTAYVYIFKPLGDDIAELVEIKDE